MRSRPRSIADSPRSVRPADLEADLGQGTDEGATGGRDWRGWAELPILVVVALVLALVLQTFVLQAFYIPSGSMTPTLDVGDRVIVEKVSYRLTEPSRGDVIVFRRAGAEPRSGIGDAVRSFLEGLGLVSPGTEIDLIKRIVGLPGETLEIVDGTVLIDGEPLGEDYVDPVPSDFDAVEIPADEYFMLGDNRGNSEDSRFSLGTVPSEQVVGRAVVVLWPPSRFAVGLGADYTAAGAQD